MDLPDRPNAEPLRRCRSNPQRRCPRKEHILGCHWRRGRRRRRTSGGHRSRRHLHLVQDGVLDQRTSPRADGRGSAEHDHCATSRLISLLRILPCYYRLPESPPCMSNAPESHLSVPLCSRTRRRINTFTQCEANSLKQYSQSKDHRPSSDRSTGRCDLSNTARTLSCGGGRTVVKDQIASTTGRHWPPSR